MLATMMDMVNAARGYLERHPEEFGRAVRNAMGLRAGVPLAAFQWLGHRLEATGKVSDLGIDAVPPGIRFAGNFDLMKTPVRASATIYIERIQASGDSLKIWIRLEDVNLKLNGDAQTPVAMLLKSGALDLTRPGNLAANLPDRPPVLVEARDNRVVLDLMRDPNLAENQLVRTAVGLLSSFVTVHSVETDSEHLDVAFRALPDGLFGPASAFRRHVVRPALGKLLPSGR